MMKIYTKTGDKGETGLIGGVRVPKSNIRIEAYGTIDELNSCLGVVATSVLKTPEEKVLANIQERLFTIGSILASAPDSKMIVPDLKESDVLELENHIDKMNEELPPLKNFILPAGSQSVAFAHVARCVCRRAERIIVALNNEEPIEALILEYINRLSDYLFVLARYIGLRENVKEVPWKPRG